MYTYRMIFTDRRGEPKAVAFRAPDAGVALRAAHGKAGERPFELWEGATRLASVRHAGEPGDGFWEIAGLRQAR